MSSSGGLGVVGSPRGCLGMGGRHVSFRRSIRMILVSSLAGLGVEVAFAGAGCAATSPQDSSGSGDGVCNPSANSRCPDGCMSVFGQRVDVSQSCIAKTSIFLGCATSNPSIGGDACVYQLSSGALYRTAAIIPSGSDWRFCTPDEVTEMKGSYRSCPP
jgi:hypothetical protein